jgi:hypothetical protein
MKTAFPTLHCHQNSETRIQFAAPTGRHSIAQGKALGSAIQKWGSPERAKRICFALSGLNRLGQLQPRALPWAIVYRALGASRLQ